MCNLTSTAPESLSPGFVLINLDVEDADGEGNGGPFRYKIEGAGAEKFRVEPDGALVTAEKLQFGDQKVYLLTVTATDSGNPPRSSECPLTIGKSNPCS